jgi:hypothetical protein
VCDFVLDFVIHKHMKTKVALVPGFMAYDITPANANNVVVPPAVAPIIAPAPIPQRETRATAPRSFTFPTVTTTSASEESDDDDGPPVSLPTTHAPFDMTDTSAPLTPRLPCELLNLETFYNPKPSGQGNFALCTQSNVRDEDELLAYPYNEKPSDDIKNVTSNENIEFCHAHLPKYDSNPQSADQVHLTKK